MKYGENVIVLMGCRQSKQHKGQNEKILNNRQKKIIPAAQGPNTTPGKLPIILFPMLDSADILAYNIFSNYQCHNQNIR